MWIYSKKRIYLDVAASTPVSPNALEVYLKHLSLVGNPSSLHAEGLAAKKVLEDARLRVARLAQVRPAGVVFTSGATEANTLAIVGYIKAKIKKGERAENLHVLYHAGSHSSLVASAEALTQLGVITEPLALRDGHLDIEQIQKQIRPETVLVTLEQVSGETGSIFDTRKVRRILDAARLSSQKRIHLHVDASQAPRVQTFALSGRGADSLALDAQKVGGVRGIGALILAHDIQIEPLLYGGPQEHGLRPGTENPALASSFATALEECQKNIVFFLKHAQKMRVSFLTSIESIPDMIVNESVEQAPHIVNISFLKRDTDYLLFLLDAKGFSVSTKSACESGQEGSRAVLHMWGNGERARTTIRISWGPETSEKELLACAGAVREGVRFLDENAIY